MNYLWLVRRTDAVGPGEHEGVVLCGPDREWVVGRITYNRARRYGRPVGAEALRVPRYAGIEPDASNVEIVRIGVAAKEVRRGDVLHGLMGVNVR